MGSFYDSLQGNYKEGVRQHGSLFYKVVTVRGTFQRFEIKKDTEKSLAGRCSFKEDILLLCERA